MSEFLTPFLDADLISDDTDDISRKIVEFLGYVVANSAGLEEPDHFITPEFMVFKLQENFPIFGLGLSDMTSIVAYLERDFEESLFENHDNHALDEFRTHFSERLDADIQAQEDSGEEMYEMSMGGLEADDPSPPF